MVKIEKIRPKLCQNRRKGVLSSRPTVNSQSSAPTASAEVIPGRISPRQTAKLKYSQP